MTIKMATSDCYGLLVGFRAPSVGCIRAGRGWRAPLWVSAGLVGDLCGVRAPPGIRRLIIGASKPHAALGQAAEGYGLWSALAWTTALRVGPRLAYGLLVGPAAIATASWSALARPRATALWSAHVWSTAFWSGHLATCGLHLWTCAAFVGDLCGVRTPPGTRRHRHWLREPHAALGQAAEGYDLLVGPHVD